MVIFTTIYKFSSNSKHQSNPQSIRSIFERFLFLTSNAFVSFGRRKVWTTKGLEYKRFTYFSLPR